MKRLIFTLFLILSGYFLSAQENCIDLSNLNAPYIHCRYGSFWNPDMFTGIAYNRHTVITHQGSDYNTNNGLQMIPPGESYSIRLGNDITGAEAESISVDITVDTTNFDLLILKYAAVMEDPNHTPPEQPRFTFDILDVNNIPLDEDCLSADFIANASLGWNTNGGILWKDWTNVGVDISDFHGQTIRVKLTTYDCSQSGHFGYAYFLLSCGHKHITTEVCGDVSEYTYSAPDGFAYNWHWKNDPYNVLSYQRNVTVPAGGNQILECHVSFLEKPNCGFDLTTTTELRYPKSSFSTSGTGYTHSIDFINQSFISNDGITPDGSGDLCDDVMWYFGDGSSSMATSPTHVYANPGLYLTQMISGLNGFECTDTTFCYVHIIDTTICGSFVWNDSIYETSGVYYQRFMNDNTLDSIINLNLTINNSPDLEIHGLTQIAISTDLWPGIYNYCIADSVELQPCTVTWECSNPDWIVLPSDNPYWFKLIANTLGTATLTAVADCQSGCNATASIEIQASYIGVDEIDDNPVSIYPNPASDRLIIKGEQLKQIIIYNCYGQTINVIPMNLEDEISIETENMDNGLYFADILTTKGIITKRILISK